MKTCSKLMESCIYTHKYTHKCTCMRARAHTHIKMLLCVSMWKDRLAHQVRVILGSLVVIKGF